MTFTVEQAAASAKREDGRHVFLGMPCLRGHRGWRYLSNNMCVDCARFHAGRRKFKPATTESPQLKSILAMPRIKMHVTPWWKDEQGNPTRQVWAE